MNFSGVYEILNTTNGKRYIGSAVMLSQRSREHRSSLKRGKHCNQHLQAAWNKYGEKAFRFKTLLVCERRDILYYEQLVIDGFRPEYNIYRIAGSPSGTKHSPETCAKISARLIGNKYLLGHKHEPATIARMSIAHKGIPSPNKGLKLSLERRVKISKALLGNKHLLGHKHTLKTREKMSVAHIGRIPWNKKSHR